MFYWIAKSLMRGIAFLTIRFHWHGIETGGQETGYILACSHVSHLDPCCVSVVLRRKIGWMARVEFYRKVWSAWLMKAVHAFPVRRQGVPVSAVREALNRLARDEVVGIFPEGEITTGRESVLRGGRIKRGVCLLAAHSARPVLPCVVVGTEKLTGLIPWLPFRRTRLWMVCGEMIPPVIRENRRAAREEMAAQIEAAFVHLYADLRERWDLDDSVLP